MTEQDFLQRLEEFQGTITDAFQHHLGHPPNFEQMAAFLRACRVGMTGAEINATLAREPEAIAFAAREHPTRPTGAPALRVNGIDFVDDQGSRVVLCGTDQFTALRMELDGSDLQPLIDESVEFGFNMWRVFSMGSVRQNRILDLRPAEAGYDAAVQRLAEQLNENGIVLLLAAYVDNQDVGSGDEHWTRLSSLLRGSATLLSGGNEFSKNGFAPGRLTDPGMLWSRGSDVEDRMPFAPVGSFMEFHPRRLWPTVMLDTVASPVEIYKQRPAIPLIIDEPPRMGTDGSGPEYADPRNCYRFARHYATECAGAVFHSRAGQRGVPMDDLTRSCAVAWQRGMQLAQPLAVATA